MHCLTPGLTFAMTPSLWRTFIKYKYESRNLISSATGIRIVVRDSSGVVLQEARLDSNSEVTLNRPQGDFSVLFDGGAGHSVEVRGDSLVR